jgi:hypothetical protein
MRSLLPYISVSKSFQFHKNIAIKIILICRVNNRHFSVQMSAWAGEEGQQVIDSEGKFEDDFVPRDFEKLDDSEEYLKILGEEIMMIKSVHRVMQSISCFQKTVSRK